MTDFLQLHLLTTYPPSNPNRDDLGRPKTAIIGGRMRQRISSQAIKRALRTSEAFETALVGHKGERTQRLGEEDSRASPQAKALPTTRRAPSRAASPKPSASSRKRKPRPTRKARPRINPSSVRIRQLAFISPDEKRLALELADKAAAARRCRRRRTSPRRCLRAADGAVDIAMFGRMLADNPDFNREAAVQVAHAFTTNAVEIEDDYYTAVDDLKEPTEDAGAGFVGEAGFGAGVYYLYVCVNRDLSGEKPRRRQGARRARPRGAGACARHRFADGQAQFLRQPRARRIPARRDEETPSRAASPAPSPRRLTRGRPTGNVGRAAVEEACGFRARPTDRIGAKRRSCTSARRKARRSPKSPPSPRPGSAVSAMNWLVVLIAAPLASFGEEPGNVRRGSADRPTRSALIGLAGAALGVEREDAEGQRALAASFLTATRTLSPGSAARRFPHLPVAAGEQGAGRDTRRRARPPRGSRNLDHPPRLSLGRPLASGLCCPRGRGRFA